ncbi:TRAP transporter small permease [Marinomonas rhizomae]|uniref:TRAP transporter small permease protein n=1 Tax=Marinomonas rhizomae TaxID=491948 RepID=A0A366J1Y3_9GAMM|nr:TRAP transporter small permease subunit [Marinomonas rhizomae]RBP81076.1 TRAP-type mannitol/chloroaromatic compound transport system permease small subunit [Marinomonas rhizomae]RNF72236.1 TRAP transporter small permease [Marinomonas rhizomae]
MKAIARIIDQITHGMHLLGGFFLIAMMVVTLFDVFTRGLFTMTDGAVDWTILGGIEMVKYSLLFTVLFILPHSVSRSQVIVDLFTERLSTKAKNGLEAVYILCFGLMGVGMSYGFYHLVEEAAMSYETTQDLLIPLTYFYAVACFATAMLAVSSVAYTSRLLFCGKVES